MGIPNKKLTWEIMDCIQAENFDRGVNLRLSVKIVGE
jgi:hypothetical protein